MKHFSLSFKGSKLIILDQTKLPRQTKYKTIRNLKQVYEAIKKLQVRGAPLIGVFAGYGLYVGIKNKKINSRENFIRETSKIANYLKSARPTAVNLAWALDRIYNKVLGNKTKTVSSLKEIVKNEAKRIHQEDIMLCEKMGKHGQRLIKSGDSILTHCNTGFLATSGKGTALSIIYRAFKEYSDIQVYATETRPLLQGARLTCWELMSRRLKTTLITDSMVGFLMQKNKIDKVIVGADRITKAGDVANKIGTYNIAVLCKYHKIPFYIAAPSSTFDLSLNKESQIPIEQRNPEEVKKIGNRLIAPEKVKAWNPAFDITPAKLITAIITEKKVIYPPFKKNIGSFLNNMSKFL